MNMNVYYNTLFIIIETNLETVTFHKTKVNLNRFALIDDINGAIVIFMTFYLADIKSNVKFSVFAVAA